MKTTEKFTINIIKPIKINREPISVSDLRIGDKILLDWEGELNINDIRIGKIVSIDNGYPKIINQYGNYSQGNSSYPNIKYHKL